jgi:hypothetical protein
MFKNDRKKNNNRQIEINVRQNLMRQAILDNGDRDPNEDKQSK